MNCLVIVLKNLYSIKSKSTYTSNADNINIVKSLKIHLHFFSNTYISTASIENTCVKNTYIENNCIKNTYISNALIKIINT